MTTTYDAAGRLDSLTDAAGEQIDIDYDLTNLTQTIHDQIPGAEQGASTIHFDSVGNVEQIDDAEGGMSLIEYAQPNTYRPTSQTRVIGLADDPSNGETDDITTTISYTAEGLVATQTDPLGNQTRLTYNQFGQVQSATDPLGNTSSTYYDQRGNVMMTRDPLGAGSFFEYDARGNVTKITSGAEYSNFLYYDVYSGGALSLYYDPACVEDEDDACSPLERPDYAVTSFEYNALGDKTRVIDSNLVPWTIVPDLNGNPTGVETLWTNPNDSTDQRTVVATSNFDSNDSVSHRVDSQNQSVVIERDSLGRPIREVDELGNSTETIYDARGKVIETTTADDRIAHTVYDDKGRAVWTTDSHRSGDATNGTHAVYDKLDRAVETRRYANVVIDLVDDPAWPGAKRSQFVSSDPTPLSTTYSLYNDAGQTESSTNADGHTTSYEYDNAGRQTATVDVIGGVTYRQETVYDAAGRQTLVRDRLGRETRYEYDARGSVTRTIYADGTSTSTEYDLSGRQSAVIDQLSRRTEFEYDKHGNLTAVVLPAVLDPENLDGSGNPIAASPRYEYQYDAYGNHILIRDPKLRETTFTYDELGRQVSRTLPQVVGDPTGRTETKAYDDNGRIETEIDFLGQKTEYVYDANDPLSRLQSQNFYAVGSATPDEPWTYTFDAYDAQGLRHDTITTARGTTDRTHDTDGRLVQIASPEGTINYAYDPATGRHTRTWTANTDVGYAYDELGRLETVSWVMRNGVDLSADPDVTTYQYDPLGILTSIDRENGVATLYEYDDLNRLSKINHGIRDAVNPDIIDALFASFDYTLAANGQRDDVTETIRQDDGTYTTKLIDYVYDDVGRLTREDHDSSVLADDFAIDYTYDLVGNRHEKKTSFEDGNVETIDYTYNDLDQLLTELAELRDSASVLLSSNTIDYTYNDNGSQTSKASTNGDAASYTYNLQNRLSHAVIDRDENGQTVHIEADYTYDESGIRVRSDTTTTIDGGAPTDTMKIYIIDSNNPTGYTQVLEEWDATDPTNQALLVSYLLAFDVLAQAIGSSSSVVNYFLTDSIGSNRMLVDASAAVTARNNFDAFGNLLGQSLGVTNVAATSLLYTGEQFDANLLNYYLRARYYDPSAGRFTRFDPFAGDATRPFSFHKYGYVRNDPVNLTDPTGLVWWRFWGALGTAAHQAIQDFYDLDNPGNAMRLGRALPGTQNAVFPDILDSTLKEIGEIKPWTPWGILTGPPQLAAYLAIANGAAVRWRGNQIQIPPYRGGGWAPSTWNVGVRVFWPGRYNPRFFNWIGLTLGNVQGLIYYKVFKIPAGPALLPAAARFAEFAEQFAAKVRAARLKVNPGFGVEQILVDVQIERIYLGIFLTAAMTAGIGTAIRGRVMSFQVHSSITSLLSSFGGGGRRLRPGFGWA